VTTATIAAAAIRDFQDTFTAIRREIAKVVVGHEQVIETILVAFFAGGHVLIEGVPGIGKTLIVRSLAEALNLRFNRIQFTIDLMPADITGTRVINETPDGRREFHFVPGPVFAHILLADEINRATPKTQSALLEAMAEQQVTVAGTSYPVVSPFFVLATLNPIEMEGTYQLPEAQLDRFLFKVLLEYPSQDELERIVGATTSAESAVIAPVLARDAAPARVEELKRLVRQVLVAPSVERYVAGLVRLTLPAASAGARARPGSTEELGGDGTGRRSWLRGVAGHGGAIEPAMPGRADAPSPDETVNRYVTYGASPRGAQALMLGAKVLALLADRPHVTCEDVDRIALPALRHRLVMNFAAEAARVDAGQVVARVLASAERLRT
jgi:MoxR-like ATPase